MGAAASVELNKPLDGSDIRSSNSLQYARSEVIRLRESLGHLAKMAGIEVVIYDASDLVLGNDEMEDFERCVNEIIHIRQCLRLHTQKSRRSARSYTSLKIEDMEEKDDARSDSGSESD